MILRANKAMRNRFMSQYVDLVELDYRLVYYGSTTPSFSPPWEAVLAGTLSDMVETCLPQLEGWLLVSCYPLYDEAGTKWGAASGVQDVTQPRPHEEAVRDMRQWA